MPKERIPLEQPYKDAILNDWKSIKIKLAKRGITKLDAILNELGWPEDERQSKSTFTRLENGEGSNRSIIMLKHVIDSYLAMPTTKMRFTRPAVKHLLKKRWSYFHLTRRHDEVHRERIVSVWKYHSLKFSLDNKRIVTRTTSYSEMYKRSNQRITIVVHGHDSRLMLYGEHDDTDSLGHIYQKRRHPGERVFPTVDFFETETTEQIFPGIAMFDDWTMNQEPIVTMCLLMHDDAAKKHGLDSPIRDSGKSVKDEKKCERLAKLWSSLKDDAFTSLLPQA